MQTVCGGNACAKEKYEEGKKEENDSTVSILNRMTREGLSVSVLFE